MGKLGKRMILLYHPTSPDAHCWIVGNVSGKGTLAEAAIASKSCSEVVLLLSVDVVLTHVTLPKIKKSKQKQALTYALEDHLIHEVGAYHFTFMKAEQGFDVAYIEKTRFSEIAHQCKEFGLSISAVYPASLCFPSQQDAWTVFVDDDIVLVSTGSSQGFATSFENAPVLINSMLKSRDEDAFVTIRVYNYSMRELLLDVDHVDNVFCEGKGLLQSLSPNFSTHSAFNLLSGEFSIEKPGQRSRCLWFLSVWLLVVGLCAEAGSLIYQQHRLSLVNQRLKEKIAVVYQQHFPDATSVVAPVYRMKQKLSSIELSRQEPLLHTLLMEAGGILSANRQVSIHRLQFKEDRLFVDLLADDIKQVIQVTSALNDANFEVTQSDVMNAGSRVSLTLQIKRSSS